jgi:hypothetical protein
MNDSTTFAMAASIAIRRVGPISGRTASITDETWRRSLSRLIVSPETRVARREIDP